jgi:hypothetical protein
LLEIRVDLSIRGAIPAHGFQTLADPVISLDLSGIIAFDAIREWVGGIRVKN